MFIHSDPGDIDLDALRDRWGIEPPDDELPRTDSELSPAARRALHNLEDTPADD